MKPIILLLSAICLGQMGIWAIYDHPLWGVPMVFLVWALADAYVPKLKKWCDLFMAIVSIGAVVGVSYVYGDFSWLIPASGTAWITFVLLVVFVSYSAYRHIRKKGQTTVLGNESKSDEELGAGDNLPFEVSNHRGKKS